MSNLIPLHPHVRFGVEILKYEDDNGVSQQEIIICLRKDGFALPIISPVTSLIRCVAGKSYKTQQEYSRCLTNLLNYLYFDAHQIHKFQEICTKHIIDFLNDLAAKGCSRNNVLNYKRVLTRIFYYATSNYKGLCHIDNSQFQVSTKGKKPIATWPNLDANILLPSAKTNAEVRQNNLSNLDFDVVFNFLDIASDVAPNCALGFYFLFFGGLRGSEVLHLTSADIPSHYKSNIFFHVTIRDKLLNTESRYSDLNQNKKPRKQIIIYLSEIYDKLYDKWKSTYSSGPIVRNHSGQAMTIQGLRYNFQKTKQILIKRLKGENPEAKKLAFTLSTFSWSTHMGRRFFTNLFAENAKNPYMIPTARGDSGFESALPYLADSEETIAQITSQLENMYYKLLGGNT